MKLPGSIMDRNHSEHITIDELHLEAEFFVHYRRSQLQIINDGLEISMWKLERNIKSIREIFVHQNNSRGSY
ncbi:MAG UNVERIFIED_CONTAM: hypothetical protein LVQ98_00760 [Rickettsiaceae bacterium]|jgi:hypothetical protein